MRWPNAEDVRVWLVGRRRQGHCYLPVHWAFGAREYLVWECMRCGRWECFTEDVPCSGGASEVMPSERPAREVVPVRGKQ